MQPGVSGLCPEQAVDQAGGMAARNMSIPCHRHGIKAIWDAKYDTAITKNIVHPEVPLDYK